MKNLDPARARWIRVRMGLLCGFMGLGLGAIVSGAYRVQVEDGDQWFELAERQRQRRLHIQPKRGTIYDRNGAPLAESVEVPSVSVDAVEMLRGIDPKYVPMRAQQYAERIAAALDLPVSEVADKLTRHHRFAWLKRRISEDELGRVRALSDKAQRYPIAGITVEGEGHRFYPNRELGGPLLGFVSPDGDGKEGLELSLEHELKGHASEVHGLRDRAGRLLFSEGMEDEQALAGHNVYLTIDKGIQFTAERELNAAMTTYEAIGGAVVVIDPQTGEILALANAPGLQPQRLLLGRPRRPEEPGARRSLRAGQRDEGLHHRQRPRGQEPRARRVDLLRGGDDGDRQPDHPRHPRLQVAHRHPDPQPLVQHRRRQDRARPRRGPRLRGAAPLRLRRHHGRALPRRVAGRAPPLGRPWVQTETAAAAYGQGISVTTLQLAMGMAALANNGRLLEPVLVKRVSDGTGVTLSEAAPHVRRDAIPPGVAQLMAEMLVSVTEGEGTGVEAAIPGFKVAGKTGTAQKIDPATHRYSDTHYIASFTGFVPAEKPRLVIAVVLDDAMGGVHAGGSVAGPVFRRVGEMALRYLGVTPRGSSPMKLSDVGERARDGDVATNTYQVMNEAAGKGAAEPGGGVVTASAPMRSGEARVPDFAGWPQREAVKTTVGLGLQPVVEGTGRLSRQEPPAGTVLPSGATVKLVFEPST